MPKRSLSPITGPRMRFVPIKTDEQSDMQSLHRVGVRALGGASHDHCQICVLGINTGKRRSIQERIESRFLRQSGGWALLDFANASGNGYEVPTRLLLVAFRNPRSSVRNSFILHMRAERTSPLRKHLILIRTQPLVRHGEEQPRRDARNAVRCHLQFGTAPAVDFVQSVLRACSIHQRHGGFKARSATFPKRR